MSSASRPSVWSGIGALARAAAESRAVPSAAMFNECAVDAAVERATQAGFNVVMLADEQAAYADLVRRVAGVVFAGPRGPWPSRPNWGSCRSGKGTAGARRRLLTDPRPGGPVRRAFRRGPFRRSAPATSRSARGTCDLNCAPGGNSEKVRGSLGAPRWQRNLGSLARPRRLGSGVAKVNYGTYLKQRCIDRILRQWCGGRRRGKPHERSVAAAKRT